MFFCENRPEISQMFHLIPLLECSKIKFVVLIYLLLFIIWLYWRTKENYIYCALCWTIHFGDPEDQICNFLLVLLYVLKMIKKMFKIIGMHLNLSTKTLNEVQFWVEHYSPKKVWNVKTHVDLVFKNSVYHFISVKVCL